MVGRTGYASPVSPAVATPMLLARHSDHISALRHVHALYRAGNDIDDDRSDKAGDAISSDTDTISRWRLSVTNISRGNSMLPYITEGTPCWPNMLSYTNAFW